MAVYQINVFDKNWRIINTDYKRFDDRQQAELAAERDRDWLGGMYYEAVKIR